MDGRYLYEVPRPRFPGGRASSLVEALQLAAANGEAHVAMFRRHLQILEGLKAHRFATVSAGISQEAVASAGSAGSTTAGDSTGSTITTTVSAAAAATTTTTTTTACSAGSTTITAGSSGSSTITVGSSGSSTITVGSSGSTSTTAGSALQHLDELDKTVAFFDSMEKAKVPLYHGAGGAEKGAILMKEICLQLHLYNPLLLVHGAEDIW